MAVLLGLALASLPARAAIVVDGKLDEPEWQQAQKLSGFKTTDPNTQAEPELATIIAQFIPPLQGRAGPISADDGDDPDTPATRPSGPVRKGH